MVKVLIQSRTEEAIEDCDYRDAYKITKDGKNIFSVYDGEPEDSNLSRDFSDVYSVGTLLEEFYNLGKQGVGVEFEHQQSDKI